MLGTPRLLKKQTKDFCILRKEIEEKVQLLEFGGRLKSCMTATQGAAALGIEIQGERTSHSTCLSSVARALAFLGSVFFPAQLDY